MEKIYKLLKLLIWVLAFAVVIVGASLLYNRLSGEVEFSGIATTPQATEYTGEAVSETEEQPSLAPDFTVYDLDGNAHKLSDFQGKPVLLNFWASWCGPCKSEMPDFNEAYLAQGEEIQFLMVNMTDGARETLDIAKGFVADAGYSFPVLYDVNQEAAMTYGVSSLPTTIFIAADGTMTAYAMGAIDAETLQRGIAMIAE